MTTQHLPAPTARAQKQYQDALPRLDLEQNSRVLVRVNPINRGSQPLQGEFLGTCHYEFLILRLPTVPGLLNKLLPQTMVEVRYMYEGAVNAFTTDIINYTSKPTLLLFTTYPERMSIMETRRHQRVMCALPILVSSSKGDAKGIICDLSLGGCRISIDLPGKSALRELNVGENIVVQMPLSVEGLACGGSALIRNIEITGGRMVAGIAFVDKHPDFSSLIGEYIAMVQKLV